MFIKKMTFHNHKSNQLSKLFDDIQETIEYLTSRFSQYGNVSPTLCFKVYGSIMEHQKALIEFDNQDQHSNTLEGMLPVIKNFMFMKLTQDMSLLGNQVLKFASVCTLSDYQKDYAAEGVMATLKSIDLYIKTLRQNNEPKPPIFSLN